MRQLVIPVVFGLFCSLFAAASSPPKGVFPLAELEKAKTQAADKKEPLIFVVTDLNSSCGLCNSANADIFKSFRTVGTFVFINNKKGEINSAPATVRAMYQDPAAGKTIPITLVTTADASKAIKCVPYSEVKGNNAGKVARALRRELEGADVLGGQITPETPDTSREEGPQLLAEEQEWENAEGKRIIAAVKKLDGGSVVFVMQGGREVAYPLDRLSAASRKKIEGLGEP